jgi:hypothetical protein
MIVAGVGIVGNETTINVVSSILVESHPWLLRDTALNSISTTGHKSIEVEVLSGKRVLMQSTSGEYTKVPINNDDLVLQTDKTYKMLTLTVSGSAVDASGLDALQLANKGSLNYYTQRKILLGLINNQSLTYSFRTAKLLELDSLPGSNLPVSALGISGNWEFAETNGLNISYWTNGPYADVKLVLVNKTLISL